MSLPKGFKRLEYIQSSGTQFVDTGIVAKSSLIFRVKFDMQSSIGHNIAGCWVDSTHLYRFFTYKNQGYIDIGNGTSKRIIGGSIPYNTICEMEAGNLYIKNLQTGEIVSSGDPVAEFTLTTNVCLGGTSREQESGKYYYLQIYDGAELVCDLVPCINDAGNVGMWDEASKAFCPNAGTGAFTAGPVVPESVDESEITELEYIQSSGTQYIDSGFKPNQNTRVHFKFEMVSYKSGMDCGVLGARTAYGNAAYSFWVKNSDRGYQDDYGSVANAISNTNTIGVHEVDKNKNVTTIDGVAYTNAASTFQTAYNMLIGVINTKGTADTNQVGTVKHFWYQVYDNGLLVRDYIPAKTIEGEIGLYDRVFHEFYRNAGTGTFTAGPVIQAPGKPSGLAHALSVRLVWSAVSGAASYNIYRDGSFVGSSNTPTFVDVSAAENQTYVYGVSAVGQGGEGEPATLTVYTKAGYFEYKPLIESANFQ